MTHIAWVPEPWLERARTALAGMAERHPSRTILLVPDPGSGVSRIDAHVSLECYPVPEVDRNVCSEVVELALRGDRARVPASIVQPLLISDLPVFLRWRGEPPWDAQELEQLVDLTDRLVVDSTEWEALPVRILVSPSSSSVRRCPTSRGSARPAGGRCSRRSGRESQRWARSACTGRQRRATSSPAGFRSRLGRARDRTRARRGRPARGHRDRRPGGPVPAGRPAVAERRPLRGARPFHARAGLRGGRQRDRRVTSPRGR
jgi:Glucose-6-P dehydrogenase subunit